ncbi:MAG: MlaD family protein [Treponema sp.]|nr:MlaD family protein [Treponema sp.]
MKFSIRYADKIVGVLVVLALAVLIFVIFMLGRNQRWFVYDYQYKTYFTSASGISPNMAIQYKGFTIGYVKRISLSDDDRVEVNFSIFEEYVHRVTEGSLVEVQISPIGLGNTFVFYPGRGRQVIPEGSTIPEVNSPEAKHLISERLSDIPRANDSISNIVNNVNTLLETINISLTGSEGADEIVLGQIFDGLEETIANVNRAVISINNAIINVNNIIRQASDPQGSLMAILDGEGNVYTGLEASIVSLSGIIENLNEASAFIPGQLPQVAVLIGELNMTIRSVQDVLTAIANNPLLRGGIPERTESNPGGANPRNLEF